MKEKILQRILTVMLSVAVSICSMPVAAYAAELEMESEAVLEDSSLIEDSTTVDVVSEDAFLEESVSADALTPDEEDAEPTADEEVLSDTVDESITPDGGVNVGEWFYLDFFVGKDASYNNTPKGYIHFEDSYATEDPIYMNSKDATITLLPELDNLPPGSLFVGWRGIDGDCWIPGSTLKISSLKNIFSDGDYEYEAIYNNHIIDYNLNGGKVTGTTQCLGDFIDIFVDSKDSNHVRQDGGYIVTVEKKGCTFRGWTTNGSDLINPQHSSEIDFGKLGNVVHLKAVYGNGGPDDPDPPVKTDHTVTLTGLAGIDQSSIDALVAAGFKLDNSTKPTVATIERTDKGSLFVPALSKPHYTFDGWRKNPGKNILSNTVSLAAGEITSDFGYVATFTPVKTIAVKFKLNGGSFRATDIEGWGAFGYSSKKTAFTAYADDDLSVIVKIPVPSKKNNVFAGWTVNGGSKVINYVLPVPNGQTITLAATWAKGSSGETVIETGGNATGAIDSSSLKTIKNILDGNVGAGETSVAKLSIDERPGNSYVDTVVDDELNGALAGVTVPVNKTYVEINIMQYINSATGSTSREITDLGQVVDIIYRPGDGAANLRAVVREHEGSYTRFRKLESMPDVLEDATYFIDGSVVHIFTRFFSTYGFGYEKEFVTTSNGAVIAKNGDGKLTVTLIDGSNYSGKASINTVKGTDKKTYKITRIEEGALKDNLNITSLSIGSNVRTIGDSAFEGCTNLKTASFGSKVTSIGDRVFYGTGITKANIAGKITSIGTSAFENCSSLTTVKTSKLVKTIGERAFYGCSNLNTLTIGSGVTNIGTNAFSGCTGLATLNIGMANIPDGLFKGYTRLAKLSISSTARTIGDSAFEGCTNLKSASLGGKVTSIGERAFYGSGLTKISIPSKVTTISTSTFQDCLSLKTVSIGSKTWSIGDYAFAGCTSLTKLNISKSVNIIGDYAFADCTNLVSATIGASVAYIGAGAFSGDANLGTVTVSSKKLTTADSVDNNFLGGIKPDATIKIPKKVFNQTKTVFETKSGAGNQIKYRKS